MQWVQLSKWFLGGFAATSFAAVLIFDSPLRDFIKTWQGLFAGSLALLAALIAAAPVHRQNRMLNVDRESMDAKATVAASRIAIDVLYRARALQAALGSGELPPACIFGKEWEDQFLRSLIEGASNTAILELIELVALAQAFNRRRGSLFGNAVTGGLRDTVHLELERIAGKAHDLVQNAHALTMRKVAEGN